MFAGLGLFFFAMHFLGLNLKLLADQKLKKRIAKLTSTTPAGMLVGIIMIVITQSGSAAVFLLVGLVRAGMLSLRQAQPVVLGVNVGAGMIVLFLTMDIRIAVLLLIGISGITYAYGSRNREQVAGAAIGVGLLFLGLQIMREAASELESTDWFVGAVKSAAGSPLLALAAGAVLTVITQSSMAVAAVMIVFLQSGLFGVQEGVMFVYGTNVGGSVIMLLLSAHLSGVQRQVALYLVGFNFVAALFLVPLFYVETTMDVPLVVAFVSQIGDNAGTQAALAYILFNLFPLPLLLLLLSQTAGMLRALSPETKVELNSKPKYLNPPMPDQPSIAVRLVELELQRMFDLIADGFDNLRADRNIKALHESLEGVDSLCGVINETINEITSKLTLGAEDYERIDMLVRILYTTDSMRTALEGLGSDIAYLRRNTPGLTFSDSAVEGLDAILCVLMDVARAQDAHDIEVLSRLTSKEGNGTKAIRLAYLKGEGMVRTQDRSHLLSAMNYCERLIWLFGEAGTAYSNLDHSPFEIHVQEVEEPARIHRAGV
ncbi:MAG: Na/Pi symporter [Stappiaceae bacterium]